MSRRRLNSACIGAFALSTLFATAARSADEIDVFAVTVSFSAYQQTYRTVTLNGVPSSLLVARAVTLTNSTLINYAQGKPVTAPIGNLVLGLTCEPSPRIVVLDKKTTAIGDEEEKAEVATINIDGIGVVNEKTVTADGFTYPTAEYFLEPGQIVTASPEPTVGFTTVDGHVAVKDTQPTSPTDLYPDCPLRFELTTVMGEMLVTMLDPLPDGSTEQVFMVTRGTLSSTRTRIGTIDN